MGERRVFSGVVDVAWGSRMGGNGHSIDASTVQGCYLLLCTPTMAGRYLFFFFFKIPRLSGQSCLDDLGLGCVHLYYMIQPIFDRKIQSRSCRTNLDYLLLAGKDVRRREMSASSQKCMEYSKLEDIALKVGDGVLHSAEINVQDCIQYYSADLPALQGTRSQGRRSTC